VDQTYPNAIDVTVNAPFTVGSNAASVMADFNLTESLNQTGNTIVVRPTLSAASASSQISGSVINAYGQPVPGVTVVAVGSNGAAVNSAATDANGGFDIDALGADTYRLAVYNTYTNAAGYKTYASGQTKSAQSFWGPSVSVTAGSNASAGSIGD
jgi:phosphatidate phosphatase APP1